MLHILCGFVRMNHAHAGAVMTQDDLGFIQELVGSTGMIFILTVFSTYIETKVPAMP